MLSLVKILKNEINPGIRVRVLTELNYNDLDKTYLGVKKAQYQDKWLMDIEMNEE